MSLRIRRGTEAQRTSIVFDSGELVATTDKFRLFVGDGITAGGRNIAEQLAGTNITFNQTTGRLDASFTGLTTDDVAQGVINKYFSDELAQDAAASLLVSGIHQGVSFVYTPSQDGSNRIDALVSLALDDLTDVVIGGTVTNGYVLKYDSATSKWIPGPAAGVGSLNLSDLGDVNIGGTLTTDQVLKWDGSQWVAGTDVAGLTSISEDLLPQLGADLDLSTYSIVGTGSINIAGSINNGSLLISGSTIKSTDQTSIVYFGDRASYNRVTFYSNSTELNIERYGLTSGIACYGEKINTARGSIDNGSQLAVRPGDQLYTVNYRGWGGTTWINSAGISVFADPNATVTETAVPGLVTIGTISDGTFASASGIIIDSKGQVGINRLYSESLSADLDINGTFKLAPLNAAPSTPTSGMMAVANGTGWNPTGTGKETLVIYLGGAWVQIAAAT